MSIPVELPVKLCRVNPQAKLPRYANPGDAGADLATMIDLTLAPGERGLVPTGIAIAIPQGYVALVHPRSGLAARNGLTIVNSPGTIDSGYRGEIKICLLNTDPTQSIELHQGDLIAQLVIQPVVQANFELVDELPDSSRGSAGYGSTGGVQSWVESTRPDKNG